MMITVLNAVVLVIAGWSSMASLDKTGTSPAEIGTQNQKTLENQGFSEARSFLAERKGHYLAVFRTFDFHRVYGDILLLGQELRLISIDHYLSRTLTFYQGD